MGKNLQQATYVGTLQKRRVSQRLATIQKLLQTACRKPYATQKEYIAWVYAKGSEEVATFILRKYVAV